MSSMKSDGCNPKLKKMLGTPFNVSNGTGGRQTEAAKRPAVNTNIAGKHFLSSPNTFGH